LGECEHISLPFSELADGKISWFVYLIRLTKKFSRVQRDAVVEAMGKRGIAKAAHTPAADGVRYKGKKRNGESIRRYTTLAPAPGASRF
jgi:dTDP-4-amino-4,6-dideoxygalactose transaminase